jgi:hypothetical protein
LFLINPPKRLPNVLSSAVTRSGIRSDDWLCCHEPNLTKRLKKYEVGERSVVSDVKCDMAQTSRLRRGANLT